MHPIFRWVSRGKKLVVLWPRILTVCLIVLVLFAQSRAVWADGVIMRYDSGSLAYPSESYQEAVIDYKNGIETLIIRVGMEEETDGAVWIVPIPGDPEKISLKITQASVYVSGGRDLDRLQSDLESFLYTIHNPLLSIVLLPFGGTIGGNSSQDSGVIVHKHIEQRGTISELLTARSSSAIDMYFKNKGLNIEVESLPILAHYIGQDFTFVTSWMSQSDKNLKEQIKKEKTISKEFNKRDVVPYSGLMIKFPTPKIYYPLTMTSIYGDQVIPTNITILNHPSPIINDSIKEYTKIKYYRHGYAFFPPEMKDEFVTDVEIFQGEIENYTKEIENYTKIKIIAPSKFLTDDLWMELSPSIRVRSLDLLYFFNSSKFTRGLSYFIFLVVSAVCGIFSGVLIFQDFRFTALKKYLVISLSHGLSIFGFVLALNYVGQKSRWILEKKILFALSFILIFCLVFARLFESGDIIYFGNIIYFLFLFLLDTAFIVPALIWRGYLIALSVVILLVLGFHFLDLFYYLFLSW